MTSTDTLRAFRQLSLSTLLLATTCVAVWYSVWLTRQRAAAAREQLAVSRPLLHELVLKDREHLAVVERDQTHSDQYQWHVFVPTEGYRLNVTTTGIGRESSGRESANLERLAEQSVELSPGQHTIELETFENGAGATVEVSVDLEKAIVLERPASWSAGNGSVGGSYNSQQRDYGPGQTALLFSRLFTDSSNSGAKPTNPAGNGIRLWITPNR